jgi:hypothetical protein
MIRAIALAVALSSLALVSTGCEAQSAEAAPAATPHQAATDDHALCVQGMTRARECTDAYIPALVDARASLDHPAGIADAVKQDRDAVIKQALAEWANDSTDTAIDASCSKMPPLGDQRDAAQGCLAEADCTAFVRCIMPIVTKHL